jgi:hypothetical protein
MVVIFENVFLAPANDNAASGVGVVSGANYTGGTCNGATFSGASATLTSNLTLTFIVSDNGKRIDYIATSLTDPVGGIGDFYTTCVGLR